MLDDNVAISLKAAAIFVFGLPLKTLSTVLEEAHIL